MADTRPANQTSVSRHLSLQALLAAQSLVQFRPDQNTVVIKIQILPARRCSAHQGAVHQSAVYECSASETQCVRDAVHQEAAWEAWAVYESAAHQNAVHQEAVYEKKTGAVLLLDRVRI